MDTVLPALTPQQALQRVLERRELLPAEMRQLMQQIMQGAVAPVPLAALLTGLRMKGESSGEIAAAARVMREFVTPVELADRRHLVDIVGTGGDGAQTFNISTCAMFVAAAAGARVSKHGGRSVSSQSGSADVLEALGAQINLSPPQIARCVEQTGVGFMFAPNHHPAMKHVAPVRRELGVRTLFNILGPLTNPAGAPNILLGVFAPELVGALLRVLQDLGAQHALVVYGQDGLDEISLGAATRVGELRHGALREYELHRPAQSLALLRAVLDDQPGAARDIVALNAGAALYAADVAESIADGLQRARAALASGAARAKLEQFLATTGALAAGT
ncbi:MAG: anthranilate phosphoribosyltransferase [Burkholderiales bacterium 34-67-9]|nr:MAG: anthranilate phosphoribosyltransferase [Burkholderiales bacterium 34-67-9]